MNSDLLQAGLPPAQDRLVTTCFLAALLHGIIILGVSFSPPKPAAADGAQKGLEVILVDDHGPAVAASPDAHYLAQRNQKGSGNTVADKRALIPKSSPAPADHPGMINGEGLAYGATGRGADREAVLVTTAQATQIRYSTSDDAAAQPLPIPMRLEKRPDFGMEPNDDGVELRLRGKARHELWIAADTRATDVAEYLDRWRRRVERIGTMHFPSAAQASKRGATPVVEVTIDADGRLADAVVRRSSGRPEIDDAAIRILQLAAPFAPFSRQLRAHHDQIRIAYQWEFLSGAAGESKVLYSEPAAVR
ncbi:MAG: TonB family protein [Gammaproteobacteria bacterium]|nr:TonB family protein [Gammaproteobacteria bacterium]MDE2346972.1 TonB family protein [Gammaproteobacteria bacterium]